MEGELESSWSGTLFSSRLTCNRLFYSLLEILVAKGFPFERFGESNFAKRLSLSLSL